MATIILQRWRTIRLGRSSQRLSTRWASVTGRLERANGASREKYGGHKRGCRERQGNPEGCAECIG
jgi:hypothetical protein